MGLEIKGHSNPNWEREIEEIVRPRKPGAMFRCRDCGNVWYATHDVMLLEGFYDLHKVCRNCSKSNIEMTFVIFSLEV